MSYFFFQAPKGPDLSKHDLKPCPFCGATDLEWTSQGIWCGECYASGPEPLESDEQGIADWNRRAK